MANVMPIHRIFSYLLHEAHWVRHVQIAPKLRLLIFLMTDQKYCRIFPATFYVSKV